MSDIIKSRLKSFIVFLVSATESKATILLSISDDLIKKGMDSGKLVNIIAKRAGGSGGGKPNMALGGTKKIEALDLLLQEARTILIRELKK